MMNIKYQKVTRQARENFKENLRKKLEHRLEVARSQGDRRLVQQLEAEAEYLHFA